MTTNMENEKRWYVVNTYAGHENKVKANLEKRVETMGIKDKLFRIVVAEEAQIVEKNGKVIEEVRNAFPGYLFVEMYMTDEAWYVVRNTPGVTGFIGSSGGGAKPFPVANDEIEMILKKVNQVEKKDIVIDFEVGDTVRVLSGPFSNSIGKVSSLNNQTKIATVHLFIFGRETPTDVDYSNLEKEVA